ncbi:hypothetical protein [Pseudoduganella namucuonensis]|uniref:Uncharacterized protein n=1 Tax=Pseudoduganella namucuonensis TaxID=1035707 RepID=A0A1I7JH83_9BURK|nr:hypothetical protein [Pseudoduganella namucuonensis]SFU84521.1 hypothetical protein SAMN05216552_1011137 [Pseudoduganella namucuonensis]
MRMALASKSGHVGRAAKLNRAMSIQQAFANHVGEHFARTGSRAELLLNVIADKGLQATI